MIHVYAWLILQTECLNSKKQMTIWFYLTCKLLTYQMNRHVLREPEESEKRPKSLQSSGNEVAETESKLGKNFWQTTGWLRLDSWANPIEVIREGQHYWDVIYAINYERDAYPAE